MPRFCAESNCYPAKRRRVLPRQAPQITPGATSDSATSGTLPTETSSSDIRSCLYEQQWLHRKSLIASLVTDDQRYHYVADNLTNHDRFPYDDNYDNTILDFNYYNFNF
ncbi:hypothetical protein GSI_15646 [Ganoderma sinense ZZ0214-1]|uniref:Uncharacterized protein n=1 Tax=Ganoderma sinense ZZ0214-1 TaxID=1077348 RepID=A0A2G8RN74_9APHY|nr:hypothetical protein GSI_15646 [Ganoderma sinense ZZ0214-1]